VGGLEPIRFQVRRRRTLRQIKVMWAASPRYMGSARADVAVPPRGRGGWAVERRVLVGDWTFGLSPRVHKLTARGWVGIGARSLTNQLTTRGQARLIASRVVAATLP